MSSPATAAASSTSPSTQQQPIEKLKSDISNRPFDPYTTLILLGSLALHPDNSRVGYRVGDYSAAHHLVRHEPKIHSQEDLSSSSPSTSAFSKVQAATTSLFTRTINMAHSAKAALTTAVERTQQGASSERDLPRIEEVFIRFIRNRLKTEQDGDLLKWAIKGLEKIAKGYEGEPKTKAEVEAIIKIGKDFLEKSINPIEYKLYFGLEWPPNEIGVFHGKLRASFHLISEAMPDVDRQVKQGITSGIKHAIGIALQKEIEEQLKSKADEYEQHVKRHLILSESSHQQQTTALSPLLGPAPFATQANASSSTANAELLEEEEEEAAAAS